MPGFRPYPQHCAAHSRAVARIVLEQSAFWCTLRCMTGELPALNLHGQALSSYVGGALLYSQDGMIALVTSIGNTPAKVRSCATHASKALCLLIPTSSQTDRQTASHRSSLQIPHQQAARQVRDPFRESVQVCEKRSRSSKAVAAGACAGRQASGLWSHVHAGVGREGC